MCAIAGLIDLNFTQMIIDGLLQTMRRRGPDENGCFQDPGCLLLHSRLTIIDPDGGKQPMTCHRGQQIYTIVYNGEIYNVPELRKIVENHGIILQTRCDTEVVLYMYILFSQYFNKIFNNF